MQKSVQSFEAHNKYLRVNLIWFLNLQFKRPSRPVITEGGLNIWGAAAAEARQINVCCWQKSWKRRWIVQSLVEFEQELSMNGHWWSEWMSILSSRTEDYGTKWMHNELRVWTNANVCWWEKLARRDKWQILPMRDLRVSTQLLSEWTWRPFSSSSFLTSFSLKAAK